MALTPEEQRRLLDDLLASQGRGLVAQSTPNAWAQTVTPGIDGPVTGAAQRIADAYAANLAARQAATQARLPVMGLAAAQQNWYAQVDKGLQDQINKAKLRGTGGGHRKKGGGGGGTATSYVTPTTGIDQATWDWYVNNFSTRTPAGVTSGGPGYRPQIGDTSVFDPTGPPPMPSSTTTTTPSTKIPVPKIPAKGRY